MLKHEFRLLSNLQWQKTIFFIAVNKSRQRSWIKNHVYQNNEAKNLTSYAPVRA